MRKPGLSVCLFKERLSCKTPFLTSQKRPCEYLHTTTHINDQNELSAPWHVAFAFIRDPPMILKWIMTTQFFYIETH